MAFDDSIFWIHFKQFHEDRFWSKNVQQQTETQTEVKLLVEYNFVVVKKNY